MSQRNLLILLAAFVLLGVVVVVAQRSRAPATAQGRHSCRPGPRAQRSRARSAREGRQRAVATLERRDAARGWSPRETTRPTSRSCGGSCARSPTPDPRAEDRDARALRPARRSRRPAPTATGIALSFTAGQAADRDLGRRGSKYRCAPRGRCAELSAITTPTSARHGPVARPDDRRRQRRPRAADHDQTSGRRDDHHLEADCHPAELRHRDVPKGRELLYPGVANVTSNALRELNLEDVQQVPSAASADSQRRQPTVRPPPANRPVEFGPSTGSSSASPARSKTTALGSPSRHASTRTRPRGSLRRCDAGARRGSNLPRSGTRPRPSRRRAAPAASAAERAAGSSRSTSARPAGATRSRRSNTTR